MKKSKIREVKEKRKIREISSHTRVSGDTSKSEAAASDISEQEEQQVSFTTSRSAVAPVLRQESPLELTARSAPSTRREEELKGDVKYESAKYSEKYSNTEYNSLQQTPETQQTQRQETARRIIPVLPTNPGLIQSQQPRTVRDTTWQPQQEDQNNYQPMQKRQPEQKKIFRKID